MLQPRFRDTLLLLWSRRQSFWGYIVQGNRRTQWPRQGEPYAAAQPPDWPTAVCTSAPNEHPISAPVTFLIGCCMVVFLHAYCCSCSRWWWWWRCSCRWSWCCCYTLYMMVYMMSFRRVSTPHDVEVFMFKFSWFGTTNIRAYSWYKLRRFVQTYRFTGTNDC